VLGERAGLGAQELREQPHQDPDLVPRPLPVVRGEGEETQGADAEIRRSLDDAANRLRARAVPGRPRESLEPAQRPLPSMMMAT
jgi:hypothetical protein